MGTLILLALNWMLLPAAASAHAFASGGEDHGAIAGGPWTFDAWIVTPLAIAALGYALGLMRLGARANRRGGRLRLRALGYGAGWLALVAALVSPLHWLGEHLFTAHMVEHEIVMAFAAPLLVLAWPIGVMLWSLPRQTRRLAGRTMRH